MVTVTVVLQVAIPCGHYFLAVVGLLFSFWPMLPAEEIALEVEMGRRNPFDPGN